jgi:hypothetical protein
MFLAARKAVDVGVGAILEPALWLMGSLLAGAFIVWVYQRWNRWQTSRSDADHDQLTLFRSMYEQGELTEEEYQKLHDRLAGRIRGKTTDSTAPVRPGGNDPGDLPPLAK